MNGVAGDAFLVAPPLTMKKEEVDLIIEILEETLSEVEQACRKQGLLKIV